MRDLCRRIGVDSIDVIIALIALFRPGPMNMLDDYVNRKHGKTKVEYDHPLLEPILKETFGVFVYQEQVMQAANVLAGYSLGGADILRRAMGKKKPEEMEKQREVFIKGCHEKNKIPRGKAERIFETLAKFAGYGFNKSHSAAYAVVAYQTAWLKANYPGRVHGGVAVQRTGQHGQDPALHQRMPTHGHRGARTRCERERRAVYGASSQCGAASPPRPASRDIAAGRRSHKTRSLLRRFGSACRDQERRRDRGGKHHQGARRRRKIQIVRRLLRARGPAHGQPQGAGEPGEMRRV